MGDVVRAVGQAVDLVVAGALAQHEGVGEGSSTRGDVHRRAAGEVEAAHEKRPAVGVPGPVGNGVVDDRRPDEDEDDGGQHATAVRGGTNGKSGSGEQTECQRGDRNPRHIITGARRLRDGCKHALEEAEQQIGNLGASDAGLGQHVLETNVG